jgi:hypothetical protein
LLPQRISVTSLRAPLVLLFIAANVHAKWLPLAKLELIQNADAIVIAHYLGYRTIAEPISMYDQLGSFERIQILKGDLQDSFSVYGCRRIICAALIFYRDMKPGRYLLFLSKKEFGWIDCSGTVIPIDETGINWFTGDVSHEIIRQPLSVVIKDIQDHLRLEKSEHN